MICNFKCNLLAVVCAALIGCVQGKKCLPGQQPCIDTCCNTDNNYTCCPYSGGFCADPQSECCESGPNGLCDAGDKCCDGGCADAKHECCGELVCGTDTCCLGGPWAGTACTDEASQCCKTSFTQGPQPSSFTAPNSSQCCSVTTSVGCEFDEFGHPSSYVGLVGGCANGTVCCPPPDGLYQGVPAVPPYDCQGGDTSAFQICADPNTQFCCGGGACNTEDLCCSTTGHSLTGQGCCPGVPAKHNSCNPSLNFNTCPGDVGRAFLNSTSFVRGLHENPAKARALADQLIKEVPDVNYG
jgi:hypothetical protein